MQDNKDTALMLRINFDKGVRNDDKEITQLLKSSELIHRLTADFISKPLYAIWRIIALSEIPYAKQLN